MAPSDIMSSLRVSLGGSALPALLLVAHVTCGLFWFGSTWCPQLGFAQQMSHTSGSSHILGFPFQLRLSLHSSERSLLRSSLQKSHPCYLLPVNLAVSLIIYSCRLQVENHDCEYHLLLPAQDTAWSLAHMCSGLCVSLTT